MSKAKCEITMVRVLTEDWTCNQVTGEMEPCGFISDGGASEFDSYYCDEHREGFETWAEALAHKNHGIFQTIASVLRIAQ